MSGRPDLSASVQEWLRYAEGDLAVAEREMMAEMPVYHIVCFHCQGAAEKYLKAFLLSREWALIKVHDILTLLGECMPYDNELPLLQTEAKLLNDYITAGRYPGDIAIAGIGKTEAEEALAAARRIRDRVLDLMRK